MPTKAECPPSGIRLLCHRLKLHSTIRLHSTSEHLVSTIFYLVMGEHARRKTHAKSHQLCVAGDTQLGPGSCAEFKRRAATTAKAVERLALSPARA
jgi:hypothetical protein